MMDLYSNLPNIRNIRKYPVLNRTISCWVPTAARWSVVSRRESIRYKYRCTGYPVLGTNGPLSEFAEYSEISGIKQDNFLLGTYCGQMISCLKKGKHNVQVSMYWISGYWWTSIRICRIPGNVLYQTRQFLAGLPLRPDG